MKVLVAASGGVDSTITATLLQNTGLEIELAYMKLHIKPGYHEANIAKVAKVAKYLGVNYQVLNFEKDFDEKVFKPFIQSYKAGLTPNPCAICNRFIKFGKLLEYALANGFDALATGHYVRLKDGLLQKGLDESKDQSYFLANTDAAALSRMLFPLGGMLKKDVKAKAASIPFLKDFATQKESSEICFVEKSYIDVLSRHENTATPGKLINTKGEVVGTHQGYMHYTVGKRRGFTMRVAHEPHYVLGINAKENLVTVGLKEDLAVSEFELKNLNSFLDLPEFEATVKIRYRFKGVKAKIQIYDPKNPEMSIKDLVPYKQGSHLKDLQAKITLKESVYGVAPGQMAVFYKDDLVIFAGFIC